METGQKQNRRTKHSESKTQFSKKSKMKLRYTCKGNLEGALSWLSVASYSGMESNIPFLICFLRKPSCSVFVKIIGVPKKDPVT
jgi:hypothetical protein